MLFKSLWCDFYSLGGGGGKFSDIFNKIIPLFNQYPLIGTKQEDYLDFFFKVAELIRSKDHLTKEGVDKIQTIKCNMNSKRIHF